MCDYRSCKQRARYEVFWNGALVYLCGVHLSAWMRLLPIDTDKATVRRISFIPFPKEQR